MAFSSVRQLTEPGEGLVQPTSNYLASGEVFAKNPSYRTSPFAVIPDELHLQSLHAMRTLPPTPRREVQSMANPEHVKVLKQGVKTWNEWQQENFSVIPDLSGADLHGENLTWVHLLNADLRRANLSGVKLARAGLQRADLWRADLSGADVFCADLSDANLREANFSEANLRRADLRDANLLGANLGEADLERSILRRASLHGARLGGANLSRADLSIADLSWAEFRRANLNKARVDFATFGQNDLSEVQGLDTVEHRGPSTIDIGTIYRSKGNIPEVFLRGCGVPEDFIVYMKSLVGKPIEFYSCFISYSSKDDAFAKRLHADLQAQNVRCWFAPEDLKIGDKFRMRIDEAIRVHDKLLLVLSENSVNSAWVEKEVETAFEKERRQDNKPVLFPIRLDGAVEQTNQAWAADIRRTRHIGDFTHWKDHDAYQQAFQRLLRDLKAEHKTSGRELEATSR